MVKDPINGFKRRHFLTLHLKFSSQLTFQQSCRSWLRKVVHLSPQSLSRKPWSIEVLILIFSPSYVFQMKQLLLNIAPPVAQVSRVLRDQLWKGVSFPSTLMVVRKELENGLIKAYNLIDFQNAWTQIQNPLQLCWMISHSYQHTIYRNVHTGVRAGTLDTLANSLTRFHPDVGKIPDGSHSPPQPVWFPIANTQLELHPFYGKLQIILYVFLFSP